MFDAFRRTKTYEIESDHVEETLGADRLEGRRPETALEEPFEDLLESEEEPDELLGTYEGILEDQRGREREFQVNITKNGGGVIVGTGIFQQIPVEYDAAASVEPTPYEKQAGRAATKAGDMIEAAGAVVAEHALLPAFETTADGVHAAEERWEQAKQALYETVATEYETEIHVLDDDTTIETSYQGLSPSDARTKAKKAAKNAVPDIRSSPSAAYRISDGDEEHHYKLTSSCLPGSHSWRTSSEQIDEDEYNDLIEG